MCVTCEVEPVCRMPPPLLQLPSSSSSSSSSSSPMHSYYCMYILLLLVDVQSIDIEYWRSQYQSLSSRAHKEFQHGRPLHPFPSIAVACLQYSNKRHPAVVSPLLCHSLYRIFIAVQHEAQSHILCIGCMLLCQSEVLPQQDSR